jgi:uncharacterized protein YgfB (UPF0149 family)
MLDRINQWIEQFLVGLGLALSRMSTEETTMVSLLLGFLVLAMAASRALRFAHIGQ